MKRIVVILSGGMDSAVLLHKHLDEGDAVRAIAIDYGQRHRHELLFARLQAQVNAIGRVPFHVADLSGLRDILPGSSQTDDKIPVPKGHYTEASMKATVVPNRNMILLSVAIGHAVAFRYDAVSYAAHSGDHAIYPDCREEFIEALSKAAALCDWHPVQILRPFVNLTKADLVIKGTSLGVRFDQTYSCYEGGPVHCGTCGTCFERREAFSIAGIQDPTEYMDKRPFSKVLEEQAKKA